MLMNKVDQRRGEEKGGKERDWRRREG